MNRRKFPLLRWMPISLLLLSLIAVANAATIAPTALGDQLARYFTPAAQTLAWISGAALFNQLARWIFWDTFVARALGGPVPGVLKEIFAVLVYLVAITCIVGFAWHLSVTGFLAALGAGGVVLGFALRDLFADIFTGLAINIDRTFAIGDWVQINEVVGGPTVARIREIGWRCTSLVTEEQTTVIVPNTMLGQERVTNITQPIEPTRFELELTVEFSVPSDRVKRVLLASVKALSDHAGFAAGHEPVILIKGTSSLGVEYLVRYWILPWDPNSPSTWRDLVLANALSYLSTAGISLAYPKSDVYHAEMPERQVEGRTAADELKLLSKIPLFEPLKIGELKHLVQTLRRRIFDPGQTLVRTGDSGDSLFVLIEGLLAVKVERDGKLQQVACIEPGQCFGEMSLLTGEPRSATIHAITQSVVYEVHREPLKHLMDQRSELAEHLSRILAVRQLETREALKRNEAFRETEEFDSLARQLLARMREILGSSRLHPPRQSSG